MFLSLTNALEGAGATLEKDSCQMISETPYVSGNCFIIYYLLKCVPNRNVVFLSMQNTWSHYCNISNKLGVNLRAKAEEGSVKVLEGLKILPEILIPDAVEDNPFDFLVKETCASLQHLYNKVNRLVESFQDKSKPTALIIDGLSTFLSLGISTNEIELFIQYCSNMLSYPQDLFVFSLSVDEVDHSSKKLYTQLFHQCSTVLSVKGLSTGASKNIHGELIVHVSPDNYLSKGLRYHKRFHYEIEQRDVKVFSPGLGHSC